MRPRARFAAVATKLLSVLLARPALLNGCPRSLSNSTLILQKYNRPKLCSVLIIFAEEVRFARV